MSNKIKNKDDSIELVKVHKLKAKDIYLDKNLKNLKLILAIFL